MLNETSFDARFREREQITAAVIATAVEAINRAEDRQFDAVVAVSFEMVMQRKLAVWAQGGIASKETGLKVKDIGLRILAGMILAGRSVEKNKPVPANVTDGASALTYVTGLDQREIRTNPRDFLKRAKALAGHALAKYPGIIVQCLSADSWEAGAKAYATFVRESLGNSLDGLEVALFKPSKSGGNQGTKKTVAERILAIAQGDDVTEQDIAEAITNLNAIYAVIVARKAPTKTEQQPELLAA